MNSQTNLKYRTWFKGIPPRPIKLEVPGWAGEKTYNTGQPWHCKPFIDGSTYGLELIYPFDTECTVTTKDGELVFSGDFTEERSQIGQSWDRPFSSFAPHHFGFTSSLDLKTDEGYGTMILPHPRYYTDRTGTVPLVVGGMIESDFWPRVFFIVFKSPLEGQTYIFRKGEPYAQILILPKNVNYNIMPMSNEEAKSRQEQEQILSDFAPDIATKTWKTKKNESFDNKYKVLSKVAKRDGSESVCPYLQSIQSNTNATKVDKQDQARRKFPRKVIKSCTGPQ
jgi:hypothetical protein